MAVEISSVSTYQLQRYGGVTVQNKHIWLNSFRSDDPGTVEAVYKRMSAANPDAKYRIVKRTTTETQVQPSHL